MRISRRILVCAALAATTATLACCASPPPASAGILPEGACKALGNLSSLGGKACDALSNPGQLLKTGKSLITGHIGSAIKDFLGSGGASSASTALSLAAIVAWVVDGARAALREMGKVVNETAAPQLGSVWFSSTYWRMAGVAALLTLPFLFAAAVQALVRSDLSLLARAAFGHLPLALVGVGIAAPVTMLLLSGTDELCALVWSPNSTNGLSAALAGGGIARVVGFVDSPFLAFLLCVFTAGAAVVVWLELAMREAAVYIVVLMLPLAFAALVWPARRVWAVRAVEMLVALILSKFAIVAVLGLGGAALDHAAAHGLGAMLAGMVLVLLAAFAPWAVLRLVPLAEVADSAAGSLRSHARAALDTSLGARSIEGTDTLLATVAGHVANLARSSANEREAGPDLAMSNGHSPNGAARAEQPPYDWEDDAPQAAAAEERHQDDTSAGFASHVDRGDLADLAGEETSTSAPAERVPGADPLWQAPDMSWPPLPLGLDEGWPPDPPWPGVGNQPEDSSQVTSGSGEDAVAKTAPPAAEQSDPLPPPPDREGSL